MKTRNVFGEDLDIPIRKDKSSGRVYAIKNGIEVPSVTTILGIIHNAPLMQWLFKQVDARGIEALDDTSAADRGTEIHEYCEQLVNGVPYKALGHPKEYTRQIKLFQSWMRRRKEQGWEVESEVQLYSIKNRYAGTADVLLRKEEEDGYVYRIVDIKTGKRVHEQHAWQLAAYSCAWQEITGADSLENIGASVLHIPDRNQSAAKPREVIMTKNDFNLAVDVFFSALQIVKTTKAFEQSADWLKIKKRVDKGENK